VSKPTLEVISFVPDECLDYKMPSCERFVDGGPTSLIEE
jgi:hypothetical protein